MNDVIADLLEKNLNWYKNASEWEVLFVFGGLVLVIYFIRKKVKGI